MKSKSLTISFILVLFLVALFFLFYKSENKTLNEIKTSAIRDSSKIIEVVKYIKSIRDTIQTTDSTKIQIILFSNNNSMYLRFKSEFIQLSNSDIFNFLQSSNILFVEEDGFSSKFEMSAYGDDKFQYYIYYSDHLLDNHTISYVDKVERISNNLYLVTMKK